MKKIMLTAGLALSFMVEATPWQQESTSTMTLAEVGDTGRGAQYAHHGERYQRHRNQRYQRQPSNQNYRYQTQRQNQQVNRYNNRYYRDSNRNQYQQRQYRRGNQWYTEPGAQNRYHRSNRYRNQPTQRVRYSREEHRNIKIRYSTKLCESGQYPCITIKRGQSWAKLFPDKTQRDIVRRLNRTNLKLRRGAQIAVPENLPELDLLDVAPFERRIDAQEGKLILVSLPKQAWAAYDDNGQLLRWGPASGGKNWCGDINKPCNTIQGVFNVFNKKDAHCRSGSFPVDRGGGSPMPYCMFFHTGFALHGSYEVPGYNASHGCIRLYKEDAKWLNERFVELPMFEHDKGTQVIVHTTEQDKHLESQALQDRHLDEYDIENSYYDL